MPIATAQTVAEAAAEWDDLPPLLFTGGGSGPERRASSEGALDSFLEAVRADGRIIVFDRVAKDDGALDSAVAATAFDTRGLSDRRQVCVMRRVDELTREDSSRVKTLAAARGKWWVMSAASAGGVRFSGYLHVRAGNIVAEGPSEAAGPLTIRGVRDVAPAVASGADIVDLIEAFQRYAFDHADPHAAAAIAARLDLDVRTNKRPLMLSALIEDSVRDVEDQIPGSYMPGASSSELNPDA